MGGVSDGSSSSSLSGGKNSSTSFSLVGKMEGVSEADIPKSLRCSGVEGAAGGAAGGVEAGEAPAWAAW